MDAFVSNLISNEITRWTFSTDYYGNKVVRLEDSLEVKDEEYVLAADHDREIERLRADLAVKTEARNKWMRDCVERGELLSKLRAALTKIAAYDPGKFRPLEDEIAIWKLATEALSGDSSSPEASPSGWQPIETAPKSPSDAGRDRRYVLVVYPGWKDGKPNPFVLMAYQDSLGWDTGTWRLHETPTHWMPLPALPSSQKTNEHSVKGLASAGSSAAVNPRDTVGGSAEPSGRPAENTND